jgi:uncharacterized membrane protein HdeD (DUF308 family)
VFSGSLSVVLAIFSFRHFGDGDAVVLLALWIGIGFVFQGVTATTVGISESHAGIGESHDDEFSSH